MLTVLIAVVGLSAFPVENGDTALGEEWLKAPLAGIVDALQSSLPGWLGDVLRVYVGLTGALVLFAAATTSISGFTRLAHSLGEHGQLPRSFGRLNRRTLVSPQAILAAAGISIALVIGTALTGDDVAFLASLYSFGVLLAFAAAQLAVIRLRYTEPDLARPFRAPLAAPLIGAPARDRRLDRLDGDAPGRALRRPDLARGRPRRLPPRPSQARQGLFAGVDPIEELPPGADFQPRARADEARPDRRGDGGDGGRAREGARCERPCPLRDPRPARPAARRPDAATRRSRRRRRSQRPRSSATRTTSASSPSPSGRARSGRRSSTRRPSAAADLIVLGSSPRWRRQSAFFSPTVDYVLRNAPCEVLVVAFPQGVLEEDVAATLRS